MKTPDALRKAILPVSGLLALALMTGCHQEEKANQAGNAAWKPSAAAASASATPSAEKNSFDAVTAKLDRGGDFYLYLSTEKWLDGLSKNIEGARQFVLGLPDLGETEKAGIDKAITVITSITKGSGVEEISGVGMSSLAIEDGFYRNRMIIHHYPGRNSGLIWSLFGKGPHPLDGLNLLPEKTVMASFGDLDLALLWTAVRTNVAAVAPPAFMAQIDQGLAQFAAATGLEVNDLLASLGGEYGIVLTLDDARKITLPIPGHPLEIPEPALALVLKVRNDLVFKRIDQLLSTNPALSKMVAKTEIGDLRMRAVGIPVPIPIYVKPSMARLGDYLIFSTSDLLVEEMAAVRSGQKKGFKATDSFKRMSRDIPMQGNSFTLVDRRFSETMTEVQKQNLAQNARLNSQQGDWLNGLLAKGAARSSFMVAATTDEGREVAGNSSSSMEATAVVLPAAFVGGMLAAIAVPNFVRARTVSQNNACINNLRLIDSAKQQWALENRKTSTDTPAWSDLKPYLGRGRTGVLPTCPQGGTYTIGKVQEAPKCSIAEHRLY